MQTPTFVGDQRTLNGSCHQRVQQTLPTRPQKHKLKGRHQRSLAGTLARVTG